MKRAALSFFGLALLMPVFFLFPTRHDWSIVALALLNFSMGLLVRHLANGELPVKSGWYFVTLALTWLILTAGGVMFGPLLIVPIYIISSLAVFLNLPTGYPPWITVMGHVLALVPVIALELVGVLPSTFEIDGKSLVLTANVIDLTPIATAMLLVGAFASALGSTVLIAVRSRRIHDAMQDRLHAHTWHLEQLLPRRR